MTGILLDLVFPNAVVVTKLLLATFDTVSIV